MADLWGSEGVSDPGVPGAVFVFVQTLPLSTARWDSQRAGMIEDTHEKWLDQEEEYMQERRALLGNRNANNPYNVP